MKMVDILYVSESYLLVFITLLLVIASVRINSVTVGIGSGRLHVITISPQKKQKPVMFKESLISYLKIFSYG